MLYHRQNVLQSVSGAGNYQPAAGYTVYVTPVGARVSQADNGVKSIIVNAGHSFRAGDKFLHNPGTLDSFSDVISSVTKTSISFDVQTHTVAVGDVLVNLGPDTGTTLPDYGAIPGAIYSDPDGTNAVTNNRLTTAAGGTYEYWYRGDGAVWELHIDSEGNPTSVQEGFASVPGRFNVADFGAALDNTTDDGPRIQVAQIAADGSEVFIPGSQCYIGTTVQITVSGTIIRGAGKVETVIRTDASTGAFAHPVSTGLGRNRYEDFTIRAEAGVNVALDARHCFELYVGNILFQTYGSTGDLLRIGTYTTGISSHYGLVIDCAFFGQFDGGNVQVANHILIDRVGTTGTQGNSTKVAFNRFGSGLTAIYNEGNQTAIIGNAFEGMRTAGVHVVSGIGAASIYQNRFENINFDANSAGILVDASVTSISHVSGNLFTSVSKPITDNGVGIVKTEAFGETALRGLAFFDDGTSATGGMNTALPLATNAIYMDGTLTQVAADEDAYTQIGYRTSTPEGSVEAGESSLWLTPGVARKAKAHLKLDANDTTADWSPIKTVIPMVLIADGTTAVSVLSGDVFYVAATAGTTISSFTGGVNGERITILFGEANWTVAVNGGTGSQIYGGGADLTPAANTTLSFVCNGTNWWLD